MTRRRKAMRGVQFVFAQQRGGEDVQPVATIEPRDLRGVEQAGPVHVVEEEQAAAQFRAKSAPSIPRAPPPYRESSRTQTSGWGGSQAVRQTIS
jgi:hypothetical protein